MALTDFFRINLPYGIKRNSKNEWVVFNREYMPLGWNSTIYKKSIYEENVYSENPIYTEYKGLTESKLKKVAYSEEGMKYDDRGKIVIVYLYNDATNPRNNPGEWDSYLERIKVLSSCQKK